MEHSFKFIYILAIVVVVLLVLTMGMYIMSSTTNFLDEFDMSQAEVSEFNTKWTVYNNMQKGSAIKGMFKKLALNAEENSNNPFKLIDVAYNTGLDSEFKIITSTKKEPNSELFREIMEVFNVTHSYMVEFIYDSDNGLITGIIVKNSRYDVFKFEPDLS